MTIQIYNAKKNKVETVEKIEKTNEEWKKTLTRDQYQITTEKGTENPGTCLFTDSQAPGIYQCIRCGTDLFHNNSKFESGTGWPSYFEPISKLNVTEHSDKSYGVERIEVRCARCGSHLGHIFKDGPPPTRRRYCINGLALKFTPERNL